VFGGGEVISGCPIVSYLGVIVVEL
jgi:hypothetical protein